MNQFTTGGNVEHLLEELHSKKKWLDVMIEGLEAAVDSPQHKLIEMAAKTLDQPRRRSPKVDYQEAQNGELIALARRVGGGSSRRRRGRRAKQAAAAAGD